MKIIRDGQPRDLDCEARHITEWLLEPLWARRAVSAITSGVWKPEVKVIDPNAIIPDVKGPIRLQADSSKVRFANIWLKPLDD